MDPRAQGSRLARVPRLWFLLFLWYPHSIFGTLALVSSVFMVPSQHLYTLPSSPWAYQESSSCRPGVPRLWFLWFLWYPHSIFGISALGSLVFMVPSWCLEAFGRLTAWATGLGISGMLFLRNHQNPAPQTIRKPMYFTATLCWGWKSTPSHPKETKKTKNRTAPRLLPAWAKNNLWKTARPFGFLVSWFFGFGPHCAPRPRQIQNSGVAAATTGCLRLVPGKTL